MADTPKPLDEIIGEGSDAGGAAQREAIDKQPQPAPEQQQSQPSTPDRTGGAPPEREEKPGMWAYSALKDERAKRQAFQAQVRELEEERNALLQQQFRQPEAPAPTGDDFWTDPGAAVDRKLKNLEANFSFRLAHDKHGDDFERAFSDMIHMAERGDPSVVQGVMASPDPGTAMMIWHAAVTGQPRGGGTMPSNFTGARNMGSRRGPAWSGPTPLNDIFDRDR
jgi:hypothetical protein